MFDSTIKAIPTDIGRRDAIRTFIHTQIVAGRFFLSNVLMEDEPFKTIGLEVLDGIVVDSGKPQYNAAPILRELPGVADKKLRLISIINNGVDPLAYDPRGQIIVRRTETKVLPGTSHSKLVKVDVKLGPDVTLSHLEARRALIWAGWPMKDKKSEGNRRGTCVEWEWLKVEAKRPDIASEVVALYESIRDAIESAPANSTTAPNKKGPAESRA